MTIIHARFIGNKALLPRSEFDQLLELAQQKEKIEIDMRYDYLTTQEIMQLAEQSGAFDFWKETGEDIYSVEDGEAV
jgi:hypothetical protein